MISTDDGKQFPRAACVIDVLRNSVVFDTAGQILAAFDALTQHEGLQLVRYKNKYHEESGWNDAPPPFRAYLEKTQNSRTEKTLKLKK